MRILLWHGWLLEGSGSNVYTARAAEALRADGHDVLLVCQERRPRRFPFVDAWGTVGEGVRLEEDRGGDGGRLTLLRPDIGSLLPVFVYDEYEGFEVKRFVELTDEELEDYLARNAAALARAAEWHRSDGVVAGHSVPGPPIALRALGEGGYAAKVHGSDLEYAVKLQDRYRDLAVEGLRGARAVTGTTRSLLERTAEIAPEIAGRTIVAPPGVDPEFRPRPREEALRDVAERLRADDATERGRPGALDAGVREALRARDGDRLNDLARRYDQEAPDPDAAARLAGLAEDDRPVVTYLGKFIPQKGVELFLQAVAGLRAPAWGLVIGFGTFREWLSALVAAMDERDDAALAWLAEASGMQIELDATEISSTRSAAERVRFTGRLDHRYAPAALAATDVLVVPSILSEAFGMVAAEGAAAGALPLVARHSGLAEVAEGLEAAIGRPGLFSFEPGPGAVRRIRDHLEDLLGMPRAERAELRRAVSDYARTEWSWARTGRALLAAATE